MSREIVMKYIKNIGSRAAVSQNVGRVSLLKFNQLIDGRINRIAYDSNYEYHGPYGNYITEKKALEKKYANEKYADDKYADKDSK